MKNTKKYYLFFQIIWIAFFWFILHCLFFFSFLEEISALWQKLGFSDSYMMDCYEAIMLILLVLLTGSQPFLWAKERCMIIRENCPDNKKKAFMLYSIVGVIYLLILLVTSSVKPEILLILKNYFTYTQILYYLIIAISLVLFCCGLSYRAFAEEMNLKSAVISYFIISLVILLCFLLYTGDVTTSIFQFVLQFLTLVIFNIYPSIKMSVLFEAAIMYMFHIFS